jgi:hypothetical protein
MCMEKRNANCWAIYFFFNLCILLTS